MAKRKRVPARLKLVPKAGLVLILAAAVFLFGAWLSSTRAFQFATTHRPERFTELYFVNPTQLPERVEVEKTYTQAFAIVNREAAPQQYTYQVSIADEGGERTQPPVTLTLENGERSDQHFTYEPTVPGSPITVTVKLLETNQLIRFRTAS